MRRQHFQIIQNGGTFPIQPMHIDASRRFAAAFADDQMDEVARFVVLCCAGMEGWAPFSLKAVCVRAGTHHGQSVPNVFPRFLDTGMILSVPREKYRVTDEFVFRCFRASPAAPYSY